MKLIYLALVFGPGFLMAVSASPFKTAVVEQRPDECSAGSSYWCKNLVNAKLCNAVTHCIQTVWTKHVYPVDNDSICKICLDMVTQARDQLRSNETQADLKAVFEGTCALIRIKKARQECDKLADDFVPELVEALSSQMNPQVVCSVAGLCNNAAIDSELAKLPEIEAPKEKENLFSCQKCGKISTLISQKFKTTNRDQILENMLAYCGTMSSFADGCSNIVLSYFNEIYNHMNANLNSENLCHMSGACYKNYHQHEEKSEEISAEDTDLSFEKGDDIPCDLCKQLVVHLRDLLTANTTETEFKQVLEGLCKQTKSFKAECLSIADQYYDVIYGELTKELDPEAACFLIGVCPKGLTGSQMIAPAMPLLPVKTVQMLTTSPKKVLGADEPQLSAQQIQSFQLPIDKLMMGGQIMNFQKNNKDTQFCALCEYFLHFLQETLASPKNEDNIKHAVANTCNRLPKTVRGECQGFVDMYGDAVIALFIQDIDPASLCPRLNVCARPYSNEQCPLCLFVLQEAEALIQNNRTEENIKNKLDSLCSRLPLQLRDECSEFIRDNAHALIEKLEADYPPEQICIYIRLCTPKEEMLIYALGSKKSGLIETNEIEDNTINGVETQYEISSPECMLCEQLVKEVEKKATKDKSREHIEEVLEHACESLPKEKLRQKCVLVVKKNSDFIINAIIKNVTPKEICVALAFCIANEVEQAPRTEVTGGNDPQCVMCELVMTHLEKELTDKKKIEEIEETVKHICAKLPKTVTAKCNTFVKQYGDLIISLVSKVPPKEICAEIHLCPTVELENQPDLKKAEVVECAVCHAAAEALSEILKRENSTDRITMAEKTCHVLPAKYFHRCVKFMNIYFESLINLLKRSQELSKICEQIGMCFPNEVSATLGDNEMSKPDTETEPELLGANRCTFGPSYWCHNEDQMNECKAHEFCLKKYKAVRVVLT